MNMFALSDADPAEEGVRRGYTGFGTPPPKLRSILIQ